MLFRSKGPQVVQKGQQLGFGFVSGQRPTPNKDGHIATTFEWGKKITADDIKVLKGEAAFGEKVPDPDEGFTEADLKDPKKKEAIIKVIQERLSKANKDKPIGYAVRHAPADDLKGLQQLAGHLQAGLFVTKFRKTFSKGEMGDDLVIIPARYGDEEDASEYQEQLPSSPP